MTASAKSAHPNRNMLIPILPESSATVFSCSAGDVPSFVQSDGMTAADGTMLCGLRPVLNNPSRQWNVTAVCPRGGVGMVNGAKTDQIAAISAKSFPASSLQTGTGVSDFAQTAAVQACIVVPWGAWDRLALLETPPCPHPITFIPNLAFSVPPHAFVAGYEWRWRALCSRGSVQP